MELSAGYFTASVVDGRPGNRPFTARCFSRNIEWKRRYHVVCQPELLIVTVISTDVDKQLLASEKDVTMGRFPLLYTAPEAIVGGVSDSCVENTEQCVRLCVELIHCLAPRKIFSFIECH